MEVRTVRLEAQTPVAGPRRCEREEATARVWAPVSQETTTVYVYCLIIIEGVHVFI
jgi:hypothetical protein